MLKPEIDYYSDTTHASASMLKTLARGARMYEASYVTKTLKREPSAAMRLGTAVHAAALEPQDFAANYVVMPFAARRGNEYKAWAKANADKVILSKDEMDTVNRCVAAMANNRILNELLTLPGDVESEHYFECPATGHPAKFKSDKVLTDASLVLDIKTTQDATEGAFVKTMANFGYHLQAAHYLAGASKVFGGVGWQFVFGVVETVEPYRVRTYTVGAESLAFGEDHRVYLMNDWARRVSEGDWSEADEDALVAIELPTWKLREN